MRERRSARVGTVSGLALLTGGMVLTAVAGGAHSFFATVMLGLLAAGLGHALVTEIQRQARRATGSWGRADTINTVLLSAWSAGALAASVTPLPVRAVCLLLSIGYALSSAYFVIERRRTLAAAPADQTAASPGSEADQHPGGHVPDAGALAAEVDGYGLRDVPPAVRPPPIGGHEAPGVPDHIRQKLPPPARQAD